MRLSAKDEGKVPCGLGDAAENLTSITWATESRAALCSIDGADGFQLVNEHNARSASWLNPTQLLG